MYDIYGNSHNVQDWPAGYSDEAAGIFVYDSGSSGYNDHPTYFVMAKGQPYDTNVRVDSSVYFMNNTMSQQWGTYQGNMSVGHINNLIAHYGAIRYGSSLLFEKCYNPEMCCLNLTMDGQKWYNFHPYVPGLDEAMLFIHMRSAINEALARIGERTLDQINPSKRPVPIAYATYTVAYNMDWNDGSIIRTNVNEADNVFIPVYSPGITPYFFAPHKGMYLDVTHPHTNSYDMRVFSIDLMNETWNTLIYREFGHYGKLGIHFKPMTSATYTWGESGVNTSNTNYTVENASMDTDGASNTEVLRSLDPGPGTMLDAVNAITTSSGPATGHIPAYGELEGYMDGGAIQWTLARLCGFYKGQNASDLYVWTSTEVNANRGMASQFYNHYNTTIGLTASSQLKSKTYKVLPIYDVN